MNNLLPNLIRNGPPIFERVLHLPTFITCVTLSNLDAMSLLLFLSDSVIRHLRLIQLLHPPTKLSRNGFEPGVISILEFCHTHMVAVYSY